MKKLLSMLLVLTMLLSVATAVSAYRASDNPFEDVAEDAWYYGDVMAAVKLNIINGKTPTSFAPDDNLTYAEAIKLAACMNQLSEEGSVTLANGTPWYRTYVDYCKTQGIISKEYDYNSNATRAGYIEIFANALTDDALQAINEIADGSIPDVPMSSPYAPAVYKMYRAGILRGVDLEYRCNPDANIIRGEVATILVRMMDEDARVEFEMLEKVNAKYETVEDEDDDNNQTVKFEKTNEEESEADETGKDNQKSESTDEPTNIAPENPEVTNKVPTQEVTQDIIVIPTVPVDGMEKPAIQSELTIHKQPEGAEYDEYGGKHKLEVVVFGGKAPYTYEWQYNGYRNQKTIIENGDYAKDADSAAFVLSVEKDNTLLGQAISCKITDSEGATVTTKVVKVYGPFSMPVESYSIVNAAKEYTVVGTVEDGILRKGEKISVIRNGKVIAIGVAKDLQMFDKSMDETVKGDYAGIVFEKQDGAAPAIGDVAVKYLPSHVIDTSDIVN